ncbi:MAG: UDP-2,3-diacylglucosamine diphosphatase LpxI [Candidatus Omnitrophica bacterium]|nr:UDP-2,3-diacylglucosamine diphosphatase LpxI [Candidatus Omnitrophota bacterium]
MPTLGLIAGNRLFPIHVARAARALGYRVVAVGLKEETSPSLEGEVDRMRWLALSEVGRVPSLLKEEGVQEVILAGQVRPERVLKSETGLDAVTKGILSLLPDRKGSSMMKMAVTYLESQGFRVLDSGTFLKEWIPAAGVLSRRPPTSEERSDILQGIPLAGSLSRLGIGQTVVMRRGAVVAVEAMEGTDAAILRAGEIAGPGCVVVKGCGPEHDMRFDIPVIGKETLFAMVRAKAVCLGVEARRTLLFDRTELLAQADEQGLAVVAA